MNIDYSAINDPKGLMQLKFKCPECGSCRFGTSQVKEWDKAKGHCHGYKPDGSACRYSWNRSTEDDNVFISRSKI